MDTSSCFVVLTNQFNSVMNSLRSQRSQFKDFGLWMVNIKVGDMLLRQGPGAIQGKKLPYAV